MTPTARSAAMLREQVWRELICVFVPGIPQSAGSKRAFPIKRKSGKIGVAVSEANPRARNWRASVALAASEAMGKRAPIAGPVALDVSFHMPRPKSHYGKRGLLLSAPEYHTVAPDRGKLLRAVEDALTGVIYRDDRQVISGSVDKLYAVDRPGVLIMVRTYDTVEIDQPGVLAVEGGR